MIAAASQTYCFPVVTPVQSPSAAGGSEPNPSPCPSPKGGSDSESRTASSTAPASSPTNPLNGANHALQMKDSLIITHMHSKSIFNAVLKTFVDAIMQFIADWSINK
ncbi:hypothetical protein Clacol_005039 [Clathrus columnatus]|uniref:Uncharacterized protein n=1 Tax=Clathrus columnatus TaxID=1419009 RepID=A0AAV5ACR9_9AGAM|nr:hypothetical protein Clacol_005039 [Clathrus columnatus]